MNSCTVHDAASIELYFYGELDDAERAWISEHLRGCRVCAAALEELTVIRAALGMRPEVSAPPSGDWTAFMARLDDSLGEASLGGQAPAVAVPFPASRSAVRRPLAGLVAMAALLAIVAVSVFFASQAGRRALQRDVDMPSGQVADADATDVNPIQTGLASVGARHLERSKLVVLGLANMEPDAREASDWAYERELATSLLNDTRLYRMAAEQRGLTSLAGVMRDLELVLLQTAMAEGTDETALPQIQRLIRKRGLVEKMDVVGTVGLVP